MATMDHARSDLTFRPTRTPRQPVREVPTNALNALAERLEGSIEQRACGRIRDLHVVCHGSRIILEGRSRTYHAKQLAQEAVLDLTDGQVDLANHIMVY